MKQLVNLFGRKAKIQATESRTRVPRRSLRSETLEKRQLLAGDLLEHHNYSFPEDVNGDWRVTPLDALLVLNHISRNAAGSDTDGLQSDTAAFFPDVSGSGDVTPLDALLVLNRVARGESEAHALLQLHINPRTANDQPFSASAFNPATRELMVGVGEIFNLEVSYTDLRELNSDRLGAFQIAVDMLFDSGVLEPALTEVQQIRFSDFGAARAGNILFNLEGREGLDIPFTFAQFDDDAVGVIRSAMNQLGFPNASVVSGGGGFFDIRFNDLSLVNQDLANLIVTPQFTTSVASGSVPVEVQAPVRDFTPRINGEINPAAVRYNIDFDSRTFSTPFDQPSEQSFYGGLVFDGSFDPTRGLVGLTGVGPSVVGGWEEFVRTNNPRPLPRPFDAFSIPVQFVQPTTDFEIRLSDSSLQARNLLYGLNQPLPTAPLPPDLIRIDYDLDNFIPSFNDDGIITNAPGVFIATAVQQGGVTVIARDGNLPPAEQNGTDVSIELDGLVSVFNGTGLERNFQLVGDGPAFGTVVIDPISGAAIYTPSATQSGQTSFVYSVTVDDVTETGTVTVNVAPLVVTAGNATETAVQNGPAVPIDLAGLVSVSNESGLTRNYELVSIQPSVGSVVINPTTGEALYTPSPTQSGPVSFDYSVTVGGVTATGTVTVNVAPLSVTAGNNTIGASQNGPAVPFDLNAFVTAPGSDGLPRTFVKLSDPLLGTVTVNLDGTGLYTPQLIGFGETSFDYEVTIGGVRDTGTITVNVTALPVTVEAGDIPEPLEAVQSGSSVEFDLSGLVTVTDGEGLPRSFVITQPSFGSAEVDPSTGELVYTPPTETFGPTSLDYTVTVNGVSDTGTITINVAREPVVLAANPGSRNAFQNGLPVTINLNNLISVTPAGTDVTFQLIDPMPELGSIDLVDGIITYTPSATQSGIDTFAYRVTSVGDDVKSAESTVTVTVNEEITVTAGNDQLEAIEGGEAIVINPFPGALVLTTGTENLPTITVDSSNTQGVVSFVNGVLTYTPPTTRFGTDTINYSASLPAIPGFAGATDTGVITITEVASITARPRNITALPGDPAQMINLTDLVTITGTDDSPTFTIDTTGMVGMAVPVDNIVTYTPPVGEFGTTSFSYTATVAGISATATITISEGVSIQTLPGSLISFPGGPPVTLSLPSLVTITGSETPPIYALATSPSIGNASVNPSTGLLTYTPPATGAFGQISFNYRVTVDGVVETNTITVTELTVVAPNRMLTVNEAQPNVAPQGTPLTLSATVSVALPPTFTIVTPPSLGTATIVGDTLTYTPRAFVFDQTVFTDMIVYRATVNGVSDTGTIAVTINPTVLAPTAANDFVNAVADSANVFRSEVLTSNDTPARPNPSGLRPVVTGAAATSETAGTVSFDPSNNSVTFTPTPDFVGETSFTYTMTSEGQTATGTVIVMVNRFRPSTISGSVFNDFIHSISDPVRNGVQDPNEPAIGGVSVLLRPIETEFNATERRFWTTSSGEYVFENVAPGRYEVVFEVPDTLVFGQRVNETTLSDQGAGQSFIVDILDLVDGNGTSEPVRYAGLNFTVLGRKGLAAGSSGSLLVSQYLLLHDPSSPFFVGRPEFGLATLIVDPSITDPNVPKQQLFELTQGYEGVMFAEIAVSPNQRTAILTLLMDDMRVRTALLSQDNNDFLINSNRAVIQVYRNIDSLNFIDASDAELRAQYGSYRDTIDSLIDEMF